MTYHGKEMETIHPNGCVAMTWEDAELMEKHNKKKGWGFTYADCLRMYANHMDANDTHRTNDNPEIVLMALAEKEKIEWRLEDANFHTFRRMLHDGDYKGAIAWILKEYCSLEVA